MSNFILQVAKRLDIFSFFDELIIWVQQVEVHEIERAQRKIKRHRNVGASQMDIAASAVSNPIMEKEEAMEEEAAPEAADEMEEGEEEEEEGIIKDERPSASNPLTSTKQTDVPSRSGGRDYFAGGESAW